MLLLVATTPLFARQAPLDTRPTLWLIGDSTDPPILQGYTLEGRLLWEIDLGPNIREGAHYTQFLVFDFGGDGRTEVACKTADVGSCSRAGSSTHRSRPSRLLQDRQYRLALAWQNVGYNQPPHPSFALK
jgi:hypothetical protein